MGGYNFNVNPVQVADPMEMAVKRAQLKGYGIQNQEQQVQLKNQQQDLQDQQAFRQAMTDPSMQGKTIGQVADTLAQSGHISMKGYQAAKQSDIEFQKNLAGLTSSQLENLQKGHAMTQELYNNVMNMPDDQLQSQWGAIAQHYDSIPGNKPLLDPRQPMSKEQLQQFAPLIDMNQAYLSSEVAKRQAAATASKDEADAKIKTAEAASMQNGGMNQSMADTKYRTLQQQIAMGQKPSPQDQAFIKGYEKQKLLVPVASANIKMEGMGKIRQFPVFDNQTKQTIYMDSNEINDAKLTAPGRYSVPNFTTEAQIESQTGKAFGAGGKGSEELLAFNTAIAHADLLQKAADAMNNGDIRAANKIGNQIGVQFGSDKATNFNVIKNAYTREVTKALSAGHLTDAEISQQGGTIPDNASPEQIKGAINSYRALMASKVQLRNQQFEAGKKGQIVSGPTLTNQNQGGGQRPPLSSFEK